MSSTTGMLALIAGQLPAILTFLIGIVLALAFWQRAPKPAACVLAGSLILLVTLIADSVLQASLISMRLERGWSVTQMNNMFAAVGLVSGLIRMVAFGLLFTAAFIGRSTAPRIGPPPGMPYP